MGNVAGTSALDDSTNNKRTVSASGAGTGARLSGGSSPLRISTRAAALAAWRQRGVARFGYTGTSCCYARDDCGASRVETECFGRTGDSSRRGGQATLVPERTLVLFGGTDGYRYSTDVYLFDTYYKQWTRVTTHLVREPALPLRLTHNNYEAPAEASTPPLNPLISGCYLQNGDSPSFFSGRYRHGACVALGKLWVSSSCLMMIKLEVDAGLLNCRQPPPNTLSPPPHDPRFMRQVIGGGRNQPPIGRIDVHTFDLSTRLWQQVVCIGPHPRARLAHATSAHPWEPLIYVTFGREYGGRQLKDSWVLRIDSDPPTWHRLGATVSAPWLQRCGEAILAVTIPTPNFDNLAEKAMGTRWADHAGTRSTAVCDSGLPAEAAAPAAPCSWGQPAVHETLPLGRRGPLLGPWSTVYAGSMEQVCMRVGVEQFPLRCYRVAGSQPAVLGRHRSTPLAAAQHH